MIFQTTKEEDVMQELRNSLLDSGIYVECSKGEAAPGQEEINVVFSDALNMADNHILIKNATKEIAYKHNKAVTLWLNTTKKFVEVHVIFITLYSIRKQRKIFFITLRINMECLIFLKVILRDKLNYYQIFQFF